jgi:hypothetical protein
LGEPEWQQKGPDVSRGDFAKVYGFFFGFSKRDTLHTETSQSHWFEGRKMVMDIPGDYKISRLLFFGAAFQVSTCEFLMRLNPTGENEKNFF